MLVWGVFGELNVLRTVELDLHGVPCTLVSTHCSVGVYKVSFLTPQIRRDFSGQEDSGVDDTQSESVSRTGVGPSTPV